MKRKSFWWALGAAMCMSGVLTSCTDEESGKDGGATVGSAYVLAATAGEGGVYLLKAHSLDEGTVSVVKDGFEATSGTAWVYYKDQSLYNLQYNQGNAGESESYKLNVDGEIAKRPGKYSITRFVTYGVCGPNVATVSAVDINETDASGNKKKGLGFNFMNVASESLSTKTIASENFLGNGEYVTFAGLLEANGKVYTSVVPMGMSKWGVNNYDGKFDATKVALTSGGSSSSSYEAGTIPATQYPDQAFIAIYDNTDFSGTPTLISTDKMGFACGRMRSQYYQTIWSDGDGNVYVFSPGYGRMHTAQYYTAGAYKASVMRIKKNATAFDADYGVVDLETLAGGKSFLRCWHITDDYFLLQMFTGNDQNPGGLESKGVGATQLAVYHGASKSFNYVTGVPESNKISSFGSSPYRENGAIYVPVVTNDGDSPALYKINPVTHSATKGLTIKAESVSAVGKLTPQ